MSQHTAETIVIHASPETVFDTIVDFGRYTEWASDVKRVDILERDEQGRPSLVEFRAAAFGRSATYRLQYDYSDAPAVVRWVQDDGDLTEILSGAYRLTAEGPSTHVTYELEVALRVPLPGFVEHRAAQRIQSEALSDLKRRVEQTS